MADPDRPTPVEGAAAGTQPEVATSPGARWANRGFQLVLTVAVTWFIFRQIGVSASDLSALSPAVWKPSWPMFLLSWALLTAGYLVSAALWGGMVRELGGPRLGPRATFGVFFTANLGRYLPGKVWQLAGLTYLARREGVPAGIAAGAAVVGQGVGLIGASLVGATAFFAASAGLRSVGAGALIGVVLVALLAAIPPMVRVGLRLLLRLGGRNAAEAPDVGPGFVFRWTGLYALNWMLYAGAFWLLSRSFGLDGSLLEVGPAFAAAYVLGYVAVFAPAGLGVREGFLVGFLQPLMGPSALALAITGRIWTTLGELVPAAYFAARQLGGPERDLPAGSPEPDVDDHGTLTTKHEQAERE